MPRTASRHHSLDYQTVVQDVNRVLDDFYSTKLEQARPIHTSYERLWTVMLDNHKSGGKRLRPYTMLLAYEGMGGSHYEDVLPVAAALELVHTSLLVHDDIIDRDYIRHGQPNIAGRYREIYKNPNVSDGQNTHYAHSAALLAGDLLLAGAYHMVNTSALEAQQKTQALRLIDNAMFTVGAGELLDTEAAFVLDDTFDYLCIARLKTGRYSFAVPLAMGAMLAQPQHNHTQLCIEIGEAMGIAFQLADDLLGMFGNSLLTGKSTKNDLLEGKRTYLVETGLRLATPSDRMLIEQTLGNAQATDSEIQKVKDILIDCGAKTATEQMIREQHNHAARHMQQLALTKDTHVKLQSLLDSLSWRKV